MKKTEFFFSLLRLKKKKDHPHFPYYWASLVAPWQRIHLPSRRCKFDPWVGNGNVLQCSCLGRPMGRGIWRATVHGVTKELDVPQQSNNSNPQYLRSDHVLWEIWEKYEKSKQEIKTVFSCISPYTTVSLLSFGEFTSDMTMV